MAVVIWGVYTQDEHLDERAVITALFSRCPPAPLLNLYMSDPTSSLAPKLQELYEFEIGWRQHWIGPRERQNPPSSSGGS